MVLPEIRKVIGARMDQQLKRGNWVDIGNGWFFAIDEDWATTAGECPIGFIGDSRSETPDVHFGPAAWNRGDGPISAKVLLEVGEMPYSDVIQPYPFPGPVRVTEAGMNAGLGVFNKEVVENLETLLAHTAFKRGQAHVLFGTPQERLVLIKSTHRL